MVGWYHPYPRVIGRHLDWCAWHEDSEPAFAGRRSFAGAYVDHFRGLAESPSYSPWGQSLTVRKAVRQHEMIRGQANHLVRAAEFDLVMIHWPIPHGPFFFDTRQRQNTAANQGPRGYLSNLVLADAMLGELTASLAASDVVARTTMIVTSDHWWRRASSFDGSTDHRVPFVVRGPDAGQGVQCDAPFETLKTGELVLELLRGSVSTQSEVVDWLAAIAERNQLVTPAEGLRPPRVAP
jgi:hypothetical protein